MYVGLSKTWWQQARSERVPKLENTFLRNFHKIEPDGTHQVPETTSTTTTQNIMLWLSKTNIHDDGQDQKGQTIIPKGINSSFFARSSNKAEEECPLISWRPRKRKYETAIVACGCFWNPQRRFQSIRGVKRVIVGYTGGSQPCPTWKNMKDHIPALLIEYNPSKISYWEILQAWNNNDDPWEPKQDKHDRSALFVTNQSQQDQASEFLSSLAEMRPNDQLYVKVQPVTLFYRAEEYQQDYLTKLSNASQRQYLLWLHKTAPSGLCTIHE